MHMSLHACALCMWDLGHCDQGDIFIFYLVVKKMGGRTKEQEEEQTNKPKAFLTSYYTPGIFLPNCSCGPGQEKVEPTGGRDGVVEG